MDDLENVGGAVVTEETSAPEIQPPSTGPAEKPLSLRETLRAAARETADKPEQGASPDRARSPDGKFASKIESPADKPAAASSPTVSQHPETSAAPIAHQAPVSWSADAKAAFIALPPAVQAAVAKREAEIDQGFKVLQDYKGLDEFTPLIKQAGTSHAEVIKRAVSWENALKSNPAEALRYAARIYNVDLSALAGGQEQNPQQRQQSAMQPAFDPRLIDQKVSEAVRRRDMERDIASFETDPANRYFSQVKPIMASLLNSGQAATLKDAYEQAIWANPDIRSELIKQQADDQAKTSAEDAEKARKAAAADQARRASKSISGSSGPGASRALNNNPTSVRDALKEAFTLQRGAV